MKHSNLKTLLLGSIVAISMSATSCKNKPKDTDTKVDTAAAYTPPAAPVEVSADDALTSGAKDATKDFPGVTATVANGEITLTGEIQRSKLPNLMQSLSTLKAKKINNNLTIK